MAVSASNEPATDQRRLGPPPPTKIYDSGSQLIPMPGPSDTIQPITPSATSIPFSREDTSGASIRQPQAPAAQPSQSGLPGQGASTAQPPPSAQPALIPPQRMATAPVTAAPVVAGVSTKETAAGQLQALLSEQSPLLISARTRAQEMATARGLQNSSIAAQSGEKALIDSALPIAQFDAASHFNRTNANLDAVNRFGLNEQTIQGQKDLSAQDAAQRGTLMDQETAARVKLLAQEGAQRLQEISATTDANMRLQQMDQDFRLLQQDRAAGIDLSLEDKRFQNQQALLIAEYAQRTGLSQTEQVQMLERMNLQHAQTLEQIAAQAAAAQAADVGPKLQSQYLASVSDRMNAGSNEISQIYQTQGLTASQQQTAVQNAQNRMAADLAALSAYYRQSPFWDPNWGASGITNPNPAAPPIMGGNPTTPVTQEPTARPINLWPRANWS